MPLDPAERLRLLRAARRVRERILDVVHHAGSGHVGGSLSQADVLVALYHRYLRVDPARPGWPERDRFVLSKGHGGLGLAAVLAGRGFFDGAELERFGESGSRLGMHMHHEEVPGVEASTGSLGHGLGMAVGMALGARVQGLAWRTFCLVSDGECYEGSTWEAALAAPAFRLGRLVVIVDRNRLTMDGATEALVPIEPLEDKWRAFGWRTARADGHDLDALCGALDGLVAADAAEGRPALLVADTVKGSGVDFMEDAPRWHYGGLDSADHARALASVARRYAALGVAGE
jgi:transketolase